MKCKEAITELMLSIDTNADTSDEARAHLRECERCRALLASVSEEVPAEEAAVESSATAAEAAVAKERKKMRTQRVIGILAAVLVFGLLMLIPIRQNMSLGEMAFITFVGVCISIIAGAPVLLLFSAVANARTPRGERRFYQRLGPGRWIEGVCLGIAEATGWNVALVRLAFVGAMWFKGIGLLAYIICSMAMPVHPADRQYLLRFRIARAWRRMRHATNDAR